MVMVMVMVMVVMVMVMVMVMVVMVGQLAPSSHQYTAISWTSRAARVAVERGGPGTDQPADLLTYRTGQTPRARTAGPWAGPQLEQGFVLLLYVLCVLPTLHTAQRRQRDRASMHAPTHCHKCRSPHMDRLVAVNPARHPLA